MVLLVVAAHWLPRIQYVHLLCTWYQNPLDHLQPTSSIFEKFNFFLHIVMDYTHFKHPSDEKLLLLDNNSRTSGSNHLWSFS